MASVDLLGLSLWMLAAIVGFAIAGVVGIVYGDRLDGWIDRSR